MSTQSGITASQELLDEFKSLKEGSIVIKLSEDSTKLVPDRTFSLPSTTDIGTILDHLNSHFEDQYPNPGYAVFPREHGEYSFISFIPDSAPIKQKMLFASTKNTVIQQLGSSNFGPKHILALTDLDELSKSAYEKQILDEENGSLTANEKMLAQIDSLQNLNLAQSSSQNAFKRQLPSMHASNDADPSSSGLLFAIDSDLHNALEQELNKKLILTKINVESESIGLLSEESNVEPSRFVEAAENALLKTDPSPIYILFGNSLDKVTFIYLCPSGSKVKERMLYAANKQGFLRHIKAKYPSVKNIEQELEVGDLDEIDLSKLGHQEPSASEPKTQGNLRFSKPKGPRRR